MKYIIRKRRLLESPKHFYRRIHAEIEKLNESVLPRAAAPVFGYGGFEDSHLRRYRIVDSREEYMLMTEED